MIGQVTTENGSTENAEAVSGNREPSLRRGITEPRHVNRQEGHDERPELVQERAEEQNPRAARKRPQVLPQSGMQFVHSSDLVCDFLCRKQKTHPPFSGWVLKIAW